MNAIPTGGGFTFGLMSVGGMWRWTVSATSLGGPGNAYQVHDIMTPYGPLRVVSVPLPADVVMEMARSIADVRSQIKPSMKVVSSQTSFSTSITEGDPGSNIGQIQIRNDGGFGSFLSVVATPDVQWLVVPTPEVQNIGRGETAMFGIDVATDNMLASQSPYVGHINVQDSNDPSSTETATVMVTVLPRPTISTNTKNINFTWSVMTPSASYQSIVVSNSGPGLSNLTFTASKVFGSSWLSVSPVGPVSLSTGDAANVSVSLVGSAIPLLGNYVEKVRILSHNASNSPVDVTVSLNVIA